MTTRFVAPPLGKTSVYSSTPNSSGYTAAPDGFADMADTDAVPASADGWILVGGVGPTGARAAWLTSVAAAAGPVPVPPYFYVDTTLGKYIFNDGTTWRDPATGSSV